MPRWGMGSELWWWMSSNGATHTNLDGNALKLPQEGNLEFGQNTTPSGHACPAMTTAAQTAAGPITLNPNSAAALEAPSACLI
jgi:hypothetical protein